MVGMWNYGTGQFREKVKYLIGGLYEDIKDQILSSRDSQEGLSRRGM